MEKFGTLVRWDANKQYSLVQTLLGAIYTSILFSSYHFSYNYFKYGRSSFIRTCRCRRNSSDNRTVLIIDVRTCNHYNDKCLYVRYEITVDHSWDNRGSVLICSNKLDADIQTSIVLDI